jgi:hypothetical protein
MTGCSEQKLRWNVVSGVSAGAVPGMTKESWLPGDGEDRRRIIAEGVVELVVVVARLAEIVDDVAEMEEECGLVGVVRLRAVERDLIRDPELVGVFADVGRPGIADGMENDLARLLDPVDHQRAVIAAVGVREAEHLIVGGARFRDLDDILGQQLLDFVCRWPSRSDAWSGSRSGSAAPGPR